MAPETVESNDSDAIAEARARVARARTTGTPDAPLDAATAAPEVKPDAAGAEPELARVVAIEEPATSSGAGAADPADVTHLRQKVAELTKRIQDADGARGGELHKLRTQLAQMNEEMTLIVDENKRLREAEGGTAAPTPKTTGQSGNSAWDQDVAPFIVGIPEDVAAQYGDELMRVIMVVASNTHGRNGSASRGPVADVPSVDDYSAVSTFITAVERLAPGFAAANGNPAANIAPQKEWFAFLESAQADGSSVSWREYLEDKGPDEVALAYKLFQSRPVAVRPMTPTLEGQEAINASRAGEGEKPTIPIATATEYNALLEELQFGRGEMPMDAYNQKRARLRTLQEAARLGQLK